MGILLINRNLLFKFKPKSISSYSFSSSSPDLCFFRRFFPSGTINPQQQAHAPTVVGDSKPNSKSMFLIEHVDKGITNYSQLSAAQIINNSWKDHHRAGICSPFSGESDLVGSCKEWTLFWLWDVDDEDSNDGYSFPEFSLWNPTTNCIKILPPPSLERPIPCAVSRVDCFGFGFDPKSQDYKLLRFLQYDYLYDFEHIELYSFKTNSWKHITQSHFVPSPIDSYNSIHVNGVYYWASGCNRCILSFDFADEEFSWISLPGDSVRKSNDYCLAEFHGSLAVILPYLVPAEDLTEEEKQKRMQQPFSIKILVWNGETWDVVPRVAVGDFPAGDKIARAMSLFRNEYLFLQGCAEPQLMLFNCKTGTLEKLGIHHDPLESSNPSLTKPSVFPYTVPI